eukprot:GILI01013416.1.p1 GENE.GILI01013416.1~~GILI01013416.1.p1  ORF type:complete len:429 (-),score=106.91 GILI01013416.1:117-1403(-)
MPKYNIRFANYATRAALFELQVEQGLTVGALKAVAEGHLLSSDDLCPMKYFDKWYLEVKVGDRKKLVGIDEGDEGLALAAAGLEDESVVYLEGPIFVEGQAEVGRAIAAVRAQAKAQAAQHALQMQGLMAEMCRRFDAMAAKQEQSKAQSDALDKAFRQQASKMCKSAAQQSKAITKKFDVMAAKQQELATGQQTMDASSDVNAKLQKLSAEVKQLKDWTETQPTKQRNAEVDSLLQKHSNRPLKALWEVLDDEVNHGIELPMAIIMDRRCGIERRAGLADGEMKSGNGFTTNVKGFEGATPLIMAVLARRNDVVSALKANADYEAVFTFRRWSALDIAAIINNADAITLLGNSGADVSKRSKFNSTPLHEAAYQGNAAAIEALVRLGADLTIVNSNGYTPLQTFVNAEPFLSKGEKERLDYLLVPKV